MYQPLVKKGLEGKIFGEKNFKINLFKTKTQFLKKGISSFFEVNSKGGYYGWGLLPQYKPPFIGDHKHLNFLTKFIYIRSTTFL